MSLEKVSKYITAAAYKLEFMRTDKATAEPIAKKYWNDFSKLVPEINRVGRMSTPTILVGDRVLTIDFQVKGLDSVDDEKRNQNYDDMEDINNKLKRKYKSHEIVVMRGDGVLMEIPLKEIK